MVVNAIVIGSGEYTTGWTHNTSSKSDKAIGVVGLVLFDLRRRGKIGEITIVGTNGTKFPGIREHFQNKIAAVYKDMDVSFASYPEDTVERDSTAYERAIDQKAQPGDLAIVFTPDDTHFDICMYAIRKGLHVLVTKPAVKTLEHHTLLSAAAKEQNVIVAVELHKRWDPMYVDARQRIRSSLGDFSYFTSYMSQPKLQLHTFKHWAGKSSDISYYLNSHHIDFHEWSLRGLAIPKRVVAMAAKGAVATAEPFNIDTEDTITLMVSWENLKSRAVGTAVYTASWIAPKADVHSQQAFFYMGSAGEIRIDQAHRGYSLSTDSNGYASVNPLFMKYTPDERGYFAGQSGYGYRSIEAFVEAVISVRESSVDISEFDLTLATIHTNFFTTAILEAGRRSLDSGGRPFIIEVNSESSAISIRPE